jgi:beta-glucanase (GH16 family)
VPPQATGYNLVWEDTFSTLSLCTPYAQGCNWSSPGLWWEPAAGTITDPEGTYADLQWSTGQPNPTNLSTTTWDASYYHAWTYGYFEVSMAFNPVTGASPGIWMLPESEVHVSPWPNELMYGEIDLFEWQSTSPNTFYGTIHVQQAGNELVNNNSTHAWPFPASTNLANYNTYGVLWTPTEVAWYFNNTLMETVSTTSAPYNQVFDGQQAFFFVLSNQPGCNWQGWQNPCPGQISPLDTKVQWVHVYQLP